MKCNVEYMLRLASQAAGSHYRHTLPELAANLKEMRDRVRAGDAKAFDEFFTTYVFIGDKSASMVEQAGPGGEKLILAQPSCLYPLPWKMVERKEGIDSVIALYSADGKTISEAWDYSKFDKMAFERVVEAANYNTDSYLKDNLYRLAFDSLKRVEDLLFNARAKHEEATRPSPAPIPTRIGPSEPDDNCVICPHCTSQFQAVPFVHQHSRAQMEAALGQWLNDYGTNNELSQRSRLLLGRPAVEPAIPSKHVKYCSAWVAENPHRAAIELHRLNSEIRLSPMHISVEALTDIAVERARQINDEGWTPEHDDAEHDDFELAAAAGVYALNVGGGFSRHDWKDDVPIQWPFEPAAWKPKDGRRDLVRAAALIVAQIEQIDRKGEKAATAKPVSPSVSEAPHPKAMADHINAICGWAESLAQKQKWTRDNANSFWTSLDAARKVATAAEAGRGDCGYSQVSHNSLLYLTDCGREFTREGGQPLYDFCHFCGGAVEEIDAKRPPATDPAGQDGGEAR